MTWEEILRSSTILIVDDEHANVRLLERLLEKAGHCNVVSTTDSRQVMELYRTTHPDLILLDLHMPDIDGLDLLHSLRDEIPARSYLPIVVLTADVRPEIKLQALILGAKDFITKPLDAIEVMLRIRILLETRFLFRELTGASRG